MRVSNWLLAASSAALLLISPSASAQRHEAFSATLGVTPDQGGYRPLSVLEIQPVVLLSNPSGSTYAGGALIQDALSAYLLSTGPHTHVWAATTQSIGTNALSAIPMSMVETYLPGAGPNGGDIIQINILTDDRSPWVPTGSVGPNGNFTVWRVDVGRAAHPDPLEFSPAPKIVASSGVAWFNNAGGLLGSFAMGANQSPGIGNSGSEVSGLGVVGLGGANIAGFDLCEAAMFFELISPPPTLTPFCFGDGSGTPCPCSNDGMPGKGCANASGDGSQLTASGSGSIAANDLVLTADNLPLSSNNFCLFYQGSGQINGGLGNPFGDGLRCANSNVVRIQLVASVGGLASTSVSISGTGGASIGTTLYYQAWYRSPGGPCGSSFNLTNGLAVTWQN